MALNDIYQRGMNGANQIGFFDPSTSSWYGNSYTTGGGTSTPTTPPPPPTPTPKGNDIRFKLLNGSNIKDANLSFNIQNEKYTENSLVEIDSNTINDSLTIKPDVSSNIKLKNYFVLRKTTVEEKAEVWDDVIEYEMFTINPYSSLFNYQYIDAGTVNTPKQIKKVKKVQPVKKAGISVEEFNTDDIVISKTNYVYPATFDLSFNVEKTQEVISTYSKTKTINVISNIDNQKLNDEIKILVSSTNILLKPNNVKINGDVSFTNDINESHDVKVSVEGLTSFKLKNIRWEYSKKFNDNSDFNVEDFKNKTSDNILTISKDEFYDNIVVLIEVEPNTDLYPALKLDNGIINKQVLESIVTSTTKSEIIGIDFSLSNTDFIKLKTPYKETTYSISATAIEKKKIELDFKEDFKNNLGSFKVLLIPSSNLYGDGSIQTLIVNITQTSDIPVINEIDYPNSVYIPTYTFGDVNFDISFKSNLATKVLIYHSFEDDNHLLGSYGGNGKLTLNYNVLKQKKLVPLDLLLIPFNGNVRGDESRIQIEFSDSGIYVATQDLKQNLFSAIKSALNPKLLEQSKYLTHLTTFDIDDKQILISTWEDDLTTFTKFKKDEVGNDIPDGEINKSIVLKLYEPLPSTISKNDTLWISRLMSLPIIQSVIVTSNPQDDCIPLRAPNFKIDVPFVQQQSTNLESYEDLILSGSNTSQQIVDKYLSENFADTDKVNIDYSYFSNFIKYSSAAERLANFKYKKELSEYYDDKIELLSEKYTGSVDAYTEIELFKTKKSNLINGLDGWEKDLLSGSHTFTIDSASYQSFPGGRFNELTGSAAFDVDGITYLSQPNETLYDWYDSTYTLASEYDKDNRNLLRNNIPAFIFEDEKNTDYLLFLDMIGNHFDIIWTYIKGMTEQRIISERADFGINDDLLYTYLQSFGWDAKNLNSNKALWNYTFGVDADGDGIMDDVDGYTITPEQYTKGVWRRIANNLPYLLKHKGTSRGIKALLTCYGIPQSSLSIVEFGGPQTGNTSESSKYIYEVKTSTLVFNTGSYVSASWTNSPQAIEFRVKPTYSSSVDLVSGSGFKIWINGNNNNTKVGSLQLDVNGTTIISSSGYTFFDGNFHTILVGKTNDVYTARIGYAEKDRIIKNESISASGSLAWDSGSQIVFGNFNGELDEVRIWKTELSSSVFNVHILNPEAVVGNHIYASTEDLLLRLDFEYPHILYPTGSIKNVAPNNEYVANVSASGFISASSFNATTQQHWNYRYIDRDVAVEIPNTGASRFANNKIRFESQSFLLNQKQLSPSKRNTLHAYDTSRMDSNRVGLFFSPNKDLDLDIAKSIGGDGIDDYFGDPSAQYDYSYKELETLRNYYFQRVNSRNIYDFIRLIKYYDKSLFVNLKEMLPARAKVTTGLLIAPHLLERSKHKINRPTASYDQHEVTISDTQISTLESTFDFQEGFLNLTESLENISMEYNTYDTTFVANDVYNFGGEIDSYDANITNILEEISDSEYLTYEGDIDFKRKDPTIVTDFDIKNAGQIVGLDNKYIDYGFGTYFTNGYGKYYYEENGVIKSKGVRGFIVTKAESIIIPSGSISGSFTNVLTSSLSKEFIIQELGISASLLSDPKIKNVTTASGYLPSHYIYKKDRHTGIENLFYKGSKQTELTTIDGKAAWEEFTTNPTVLRVNKQGRSTNEPILEVD